MIEQFLVGIIGQPFGLNGFVKVKPFSGDIDNLLRLREVTVRHRERTQRLKIEESIPSPPFALIRFSGFSAPEAVKVMNGAEILVDRKDASPLSEGEFYIEEIKGLPVIGALPAAALAEKLSATKSPAKFPENCKILGHITDVIEGGGAELVEIKLLNGEQRLIPLRKEFFLDIDPKNGKVVLQNLWILE